MFHLLDAPHGIHSAALLSLQPRIMGYLALLQRDMHVQNLHELHTARQIYLAWLRRRTARPNELQFVHNWQTTRS